MPKGKRVRRRYSEAKQAEILGAAKKGGLTALQVQKRFGVKPVTYYSWRKKTGAARGRAGRTLGRAARGGGVAGQVRAEVRAKMADLLPGLVRAEVASYLDQVLGTSGKRRRRKA